METEATPRIKHLTSQLLQALTDNCCWHLANTRDTHRHARILHTLKQSNSRAKIQPVHHTGQFSTRPPLKKIRFASGRLKKSGSGGRLFFIIFYFKNQANLAGYQANSVGYHVNLIGYQAKLPGCLVNWMEPDHIKFPWYQENHLLLVAGRNGRIPSKFCSIPSKFSWIPSKFGWIPVKFDFRT